MRNLKSFNVAQDVVNTITLRVALLFIGFIFCLLSAVCLIIVMSTFIGGYVGLTISCGVLIGFLFYTRWKIRNWVNKNFSVNI